MKSTRYLFAMLLALVLSAGLASAQMAPGGTYGESYYSNTSGLIKTNQIVGTFVAQNGVGGAPVTLATLPACAAGTEGLNATQTNSTAACSAGATATSAGTTHCQLYCNGTNWVQTGR